MTNRLDPDTLRTLERFGFTAHESRVYVELLALGPTSAGPLVRRTGLHRQFVYSALEALEEQLFVSHVQRNNRKIFSATRPETLVTRELERLREIQLVVPKLQQLTKTGEDRLHVEVLTGKEEFLRRLFIMVDSAARCDRMMSIIGDVRDEDVYAVMGSTYHEYASYVKKHKVRKRLIAPLSSASRMYRERFVKEPRTELRVVDKSISTPTATIITKELVAIDIFNGGNVVSLLIWSKSVARGFLEHFGVLWEVAKKWDGGR